LQLELACRFRLSSTTCDPISFQKVPPTKVSISDKLEHDSFSVEAVLGKFWKQETELPNTSCKRGEQHEYQMRVKIFAMQIGQFKKKNEF